jgi:hypothetical protein
MRRVALLTVLFVLGAAAPAAAWVELPPYRVPSDGVADCLRAAGPGQVALLGALGRTTSATDLLTVGPNGIARASSTTLGWLAACAEVGAAPGVSPLLAASVLSGRRHDRLAMRAAAAGMAPVMFGPTNLVGVDLAVAVAPNGAAVVAWNGLVRRGRDSVRTLLAAVRAAANAPFGQPMLLGEEPRPVSPAVGIDATGRATVVWLRDEESDGDTKYPLNVATMAPGGRLAEVQQFAPTTGGEVALAVAPGGRTFIAKYGDGSGSLVAYERVPGATRFAPVAMSVSHTTDEVALSVANDGGAIVAYRSNPATVFALIRRPGGTFGHEQLLDRHPASSSSSSVFVFAVPGSRPFPPFDFKGGQLAAALGSDGRLLVTWVDPGDVHAAAGVRVARGTLASGLTRATRLGSPCRAANAAQPLALGDGTLGAAWTDNARTVSEDDFASPVEGGLVHAVVPGRPTPAGTRGSPGLSAHLTGPRALHGSQPLRLRVRCRRTSCVVRAAAERYDLDPTSDPEEPGTKVASSIALARGRSGVLVLPSEQGETFARPGAAPITISLLACHATGTGVTRLTLDERLRRLPLRPLPRILDLVTRRHGSRIHVTWRTSIPARRTTFYLHAEPVDHRHPAYAGLEGRGRSRFSVTLHGSPARRERTVLVEVSNDDQSSEDAVAARIH